MLFRSNIILAPVNDTVPVILLFIAKLPTVILPLIVALAFTVNPATVALALAFTVPAFNAEVVVLVVNVPVVPVTAPLLVRALTVAVL